VFLNIVTRALNGLVLGCKNTQRQSDANAQYVMGLVSGPDIACNAGVGTERAQHSRNDKCSRRLSIRGYDALGVRPAVCSLGNPALRLEVS
jgi:hypothetical protein